MVLRVSKVVLSLSKEVLRVSKVVLELKRAKKTLWEHFRNTLGTP